MIMNRKSYLKGFGLGVIITCLILMIAYKLNNNISDEEVIKRAKELGYVESSALVSNVSSNDEGVNENVSCTEEDKEISEDENEGIETKKEENKEETPKENEEDTSIDTSSQVVKEDEEQSEKNDEENSQFIIIEIRSGESSETVSSKVKDAGLTENAADFNKYLCANGYDKIMRVGKHEIPVGSTEEEIAKILSGKN